MVLRLQLIASPTTVRVGRDFTVEVALINGGSERIDSTGETPLHLSYRWEGIDEVREPLRTLIWRTVPPEQVGLFDVRVLAPPKEGCFLLNITLVHEHLRWYDRGHDAIVAPAVIHVKNDPSGMRFDVERYERRLRSQNGEDGILIELLMRVGASRRYVVEFGASFGYESTVATLIEDYRWGGLLIESDSANFTELNVRYADRTDVQLVHDTITRENAKNLFERSAVPFEFDVLSIDIDGNDYWVWEALAAYHPKIVVIEYNGAFPPPKRWVMAYAPDHRWGGDTYYGASLASLHALGARLGYGLVATDRRGINAFFVRNDLLAAADLRGLSAAEAFVPPAVAHPDAGGAFVEI